MRHLPREARTRVIVLTDMTSRETGVREPDDAQSLVRFLLYTNVFEVEGLYATSGLGHGHVTRPEILREIVDAYAQVRPMLTRHDPAFPPADALQRVIRAGQPVAGRDVPVTESVGDGKDTDASRGILEAADRPDARPLWLLFWGGTADLAQALWRARRDRSAAELKRLISRLRVHAIHDQDTTAAWLRAEFPDLYWIQRTNGNRGIYRGGDTSLVSPDWVEENVRRGHGPLGALYPNYAGGDIWSRRLGPVRGIKEGDTPSFLALLPNNLAFGPDGYDPALGSWGGRFLPEEEAPHRFLETGDPDVAGSEQDPHPDMGAVYRWRPAFQNDFAARMDWCVLSPKEAKHAPTARLAGPVERLLRPGETVVLDASPSTDPDGDRLRFSWSLYPPQKGDGPSNEIRIAGEGPTARFVAPAVTEPRRFCVLLTVTGGNALPLSSYARVFLRVRP